MPVDGPKTATTPDPAETASDADRRARVGAERRADTATTEEPEVGLSQKGTDAEAVVRKETDV